MFSSITRVALLAMVGCVAASSLAAQGSVATVTPACIGCKDELKRPGSATPPQSASGSWSIRRVTGWSRLTSEAGVCGPITPGPGCQIGKKCKLTTTRGTFSMQLVSRHPGGGGTTGPTPGAGWGLPGNSSPLEWNFSVSKSNPKEVNCNGKLDLSITWKQNGTPHKWEFTLTCSKCPTAEGNDSDPVSTSTVSTTGD